LEKAVVEERLKDCKRDDIRGDKERATGRRTVLDQLIEGPAAPHDGQEECGRDDQNQEVGWNRAGRTDPFAHDSQEQREQDRGNRDIHGQQDQTLRGLPQCRHKRRVRSPEHHHHDLQRDEAQIEEGDRSGEGAEIEQRNEAQRDRHDDRGGDDP